MLPQTSPVAIRLPPDQAREFFDTPHRKPVPIFVQPDIRRGLVGTGTEAVFRRGHVTTTPGNGSLCGLLVTATPEGGYVFETLPEAMNSVRQEPDDLSELIAETKGQAPPHDDWNALAGYLDEIAHEVERLRSSVTSWLGANAWDDMPDKLAHILLLDAGNTLETIEGAATTGARLGRLAGVDGFASAVQELLDQPSCQGNSRRAWLHRLAIKHHASVARLTVFLLSVNEIEPNEFYLVQKLAERVGLFPENRAAFRLIREMERAREDGRTLGQSSVERALEGLYAERALPNLIIPFAGLLAGRRTTRPAWERLHQVATDGPGLIAALGGDDICRTWLDAMFRVSQNLETAFTEEPETRDEAVLRQIRLLRHLWIHRAHTLYPRVTAADWMPEPPDQARRG